MSKIIITNDNKQYKPPGFALTTAGFLAGSASIGLITQNVGKPILKVINSKINKVYQSLPDDAFDSSVAEKARKLAELDKKGITIVDAGELNIKEWSKKLKIIIVNNSKDFNIEELLKLNGTDLESFKMMPLKDKFRLCKNIIKKYLLYLDVKKIMLGENSSYNSGTKEIYTNLKIRPIDITHEIGHAIHYNSKGFWRGIKNYKPVVPFLNSIILYNGLIKHKKANGEKCKNKFDKATDFMKNNAGLIIGGMYVPIVAEEIHASVLGNKIAKKIFSAQTYKGVLKSTKLAALTYIVVGAFTSLSIAAAIKIKDAIAKPKPVNKSAK